MPCSRFEQRSKRAPDRRVLGVDPRDPRILERLEQPPRAQRKAAVADAHAVVVPEPLRADVIAIEKRGIPRRRVDHVAVPLHEQQRGSVAMCGSSDFNTKSEYASREAMGAMGTTSMPEWHGRAVRQRVRQEQRAREAHAFARSGERAQRQRMIRGVDTAERDVGECEHRGRQSVADGWPGSDDPRLMTVAYCSGEGFRRPPPAPNAGPVPPNSSRGRRRGSIGKVRSAC